MLKCFSFFLVQQLKCSIDGCSPSNTNAVQLYEHQSCPTVFTQTLIKSSKGQGWNGFLLCFQELHVIAILSGKMFSEIYFGLFVRNQRAACDQP